MASTILIDIIEIILLGIIGLVMKYLIPIIKTKLNASQLEIAKEWAKTFVESAEQMTQESGKGEEKLAEVTEQLNNKLIELNIKITEDQLRSVIESAVKAMKEEEK